MDNYIRVYDKYNPHKVWIIKHTKCGHYYLNQEIYGKLFYPKFQRTNKWHIREIIT